MLVIKITLLRYEGGITRMISIKPNICEKYKYQKLILILIALGKYASEKNIDHTCQY